MQDSPYAQIAEEDKPVIKSRLVPLMLEVPRELFKSISGALQIVSAHEFPHSWPELMPVLIDRLQSEDPAVIIAILKTMNSVLKFYRGKPDTGAYVADVVAIVNDFAAPLRSLAESYSNQFDAFVGNEEVMATLLHMERLIFEIFLSLTSIDIPQQFADDLEFWMNLLRKYLLFTTDLPNLLHGDDEFTSTPGELTKIQASAIRILSLFVRKYDEDMNNYVQEFLENVWGLLGRIAAMDASVQLHFDTLVIESMAFLSSAITGSHYGAFQDPALLNQLCTEIVIPNISFTDGMLDTFQMEPLEYIRLDMEGSDSHTRRRSAIDLIKSMRRFYEAVVTEILTGLIGQLLTQGSESPDNWRSTDQAIYLVIALAATSQTRVKGVITVNELVPLIDFFQSTILPILEDPNIDATPVVKADALRFVISFRRQLSAEHIARLFPTFANLLKAQSTVVASYAASAIDSYLAQRGEYRLPSALVEPHANTLFENLFARITAENASRFESENPYMGAAIARLIAFLPGQAIIPIAKTCLDSLTNKLAEIYRNPSSSIFVHCIFEGVAGVIAALNSNDRQELCDDAEQILLPAFNKIFEEDIADLIPYVYQLMAQLIEARKSNSAVLWERYGGQFPDLMTATHWERFANIPALTRLASAYIRYAPTYVAEYLPSILGIFKRVNDLKTLEKHAFKIILDIFTSVDRNVWQEQVPAIFDLMCAKLSEGRPGYQNQLIIFCANVAFALGPEFLMEAFNSLQADLFSIIVRDVLLKHMGRTADFRTVTAGFINILTNPTTFGVLCANEQWVPLLAGVVNLATGNKDSNAETFVLSESLAVEDKGGASDFAKLNFSGQNDAPVVPTSLVPQQYIATKLAELSTATPIIELCGQLPQDASVGLQDILSSYGATLSA